MQLRGLKTSKLLRRLLDRILPLLLTFSRHAPRIAGMRLLLLVFQIALLLPAQTAQHPERPTPPTRDPHTPGYVTAKELPDDTVPPVNADGNFILGPTHTAAPELHQQDNVPQGIVYTFTMSSADSKIYPGIARETG